MPASECLCQSKNEPQTFKLRDGRVVALRRGCLVSDGAALTRSDDTAAFLLEHAVLSEDERIHWQTFGASICASASVAPMSLSQHKKNSV